MSFLVAELTKLVNGDVLRPMAKLEIKPITLTIAFDDADGEGIVFFGNYFRIAHRALEAYLPQIEIPWKEWFKSPEFGVPLKSVSADYSRPLHPGDIIQIDIKPTHLGESSVEFTHQIKNAKGESAAVVKTVHVFVKRTQPIGKMPIPASLRARLEAQLG